MRREFGLGIAVALGIIAGNVVLAGINVVLTKQNIAKMVKQMELQRKPGSVPAQMMRSPLN